MAAGAHDEPVETEVEERRELSAGAGVDPPPYVVVFTDTAARLVPLPREGSVRIGRAPDVELQLDQTKVSRHHAVIMVRAGRATVRDLGSNNGTFVDGAQVAGEVPLRPGAVIGVSGVQLVFHGGTTTHHPVASLSGLCDRVDDEIERSLVHDRTFALIALRGEAGADAIAAAVAGELRAFDRVAVVGREVLILVPEVDPVEASAAAERLARAGAGLAGGVTAGLALWPRDGGDADALVAAARAAAAEAPRGAVASARVRVRTVDLGGRAVLIADPVMDRVYDLIERVAAADLPVLVGGDTGTGKELAAAAVHHYSPRRAGPFVAVNCAALNANLVESELFGHQRGAFSGAHSDAAGLVEAADGGTLFFDEVAELAPAIQAKLLRVVETRTYYRVGANTERGVDVRIVVATNRDLAAEVAAGRFRPDLYYRLSTATIWLPPLKDRRTEIQPLADAFLAAARRGGERAAFSDEAIRRLVDHPWPGNVRQLRNCVEFLAATVAGAVIDAGAVETYLQPRAGGEPEPRPPLDPRTLRPIKQEIRELEQRRMIEALELAGGNQTLAAALIEMPLRTFVAKLKQYGIDPRAARD